MKKNLILIAVVAMIGSMSSCEKTYQCLCQEQTTFSAKEGKGKTATSTSSCVPA